MNLFDRVSENIERKGLQTTGAFAVGDELGGRLGYEEMKRAMDKCLAKRGVVCRNTAEERKLAVWRKLKAGLLPANVVETVRNDPANARWFAKFEKEFPNEGTKP